MRQHSEEKNKLSRVNEALQDKIKELLEEINGVREQLRRKEPPVTVET